MLQAIVKKGKVTGENVPAPMVSSGCVLIKVINSCISPGSEQSGVASSGKSILRRTVEQPSNVKKAVNLLQANGVGRAYQMIFGKLTEGNPTGYSIAGIVVGVGKGIEKFKVGDRVAAAGAGFANHAEYVNVPENLVMTIPNGLGFRDASTVTLGGIALQGVRRANLAIGEFCVIVGAGVLGLLSLQLLRHSGVRTVVTDVDEHRLKLAKKLGAEFCFNPRKGNAVTFVENITGGFGSDAVLFTASTLSSEPLSQAFQMSKKKGKVIMVGVSGMEIQREDMYMKELDLLISTSYGPGRYDRKYEEKGLDYPYAYVRWTENRNMKEYLRLVSTGVIQLEQLIDNIFPIEKVSEAFEALRATSPRPVMVILEYAMPEDSNLKRLLHHERKIVLASHPAMQRDTVNVAVVGAGTFATSMHLPNLKKLSSMYRVHAVMSNDGYKAKTVAQNYSAQYATTSYDDIVNDPDVDLVLISTRHDSHADLALRALNAGKNVFVEKPLATNRADLAAIEKFFKKETKVRPILFVGFNRRFSSYARAIKDITDQRINPLFIRYRMNAGSIPPDHWINEQGGRIIGEACHIIDLMTYFTSASIVDVSVESMHPATSRFSSADNKSILLRYDDGSVCGIDYFAVGSNATEKESMEIHFDAKTIVMNDYKSVKGFGVSLRPVTSSISEKGHREELEVLYHSIKNSGSWPIPLHDIIQTTEVAFRIAEDKHH